MTKIIIKVKYFSCLLLILFSCKKHENNLLIKGNIPNLPDGTLFLSKDNFFDKIDSVKTINGKFEYNYSNKIENEPMYLVLKHIDNEGVFRHIGFKTKGKFKNAGYESSSFLSDSIITINGNLIDNTPIGFSSNNKSKMMTVSKEIIAGYQTNAMFHIDGDLFYYINKDTYIKVASKIKEYPNSFHLLYQINENRNSFTVSQTKNLLSFFKGEITNSKTFKDLKTYNEKRFNSKKLALPLLTNNKGKKTEVFNIKFKKHLVVFWASWCGPCRQEIPALKNMYSIYKDEVEFVSISTDENNSSWQKALQKEGMPWKQFIVSEKSKEYELVEIFFQLSTSIPYIALIDNNMKVLKSNVGLMTDTEMENFIKN